MTPIGPTPTDLLEARRRLADLVRLTPLLHCDALDRLAGATLGFKCENLQHGGAFKFRGASNAVFSLSDEQARRGVATHSSGNHAGAVALAAMRRGIPAHIVVPHNLPNIKLANIESFGGRVTLCQPTLESRTQTCQRIIAETGAEMIHPFDDDRVIAGQSTVAQELLDQWPQVQAIVVPISGGGLISGVALAAAHLGRGVEVYGAEPALADDAARSFRARSLQPPCPTAGRTIADGLRASLSPRTLDILLRGVRDVITVDEESITQAMRLIFEQLKVVAEASAAVTLAAILARPDLFAGRHVALILSGGNADLDKLPWQP